MKTAVVFCGPVQTQEALIAAKSWFLFGPSDYFLITWDQIHPPTDRFYNNNGRFIQRQGYDIREFPVPLKHVVVSDLRKHYSLLSSLPGFYRIGFSKNDMLAIGCMFHNWSLVKDLPGIFEYDRIIVTRADIMLAENPNKEQFSVVETDDILLDDQENPSGIDFMAIMKPNKLLSFSKLYEMFLTKESLRSNTLIQNFKEFPGKLKNSNLFSTLTLVRPNFETTWLDESYSLELFLKVHEYFLRWTYTKYKRPMDEENIFNNVRNLKKYLEE